jgi:hypothetical protein
MAVESLSRTQGSGVTGGLTAGAEPMPAADAEQHRGWFRMVLLYLILDYGRPQDFLPIGFLRPQLIVSLVLLWFLVRNWRSLPMRRQIKQFVLLCALLLIYVPFARNNFYAFVTAR